MKENESKKVNIHQGHRQRLREKVLKSGLEDMAEHQVLEYILSFIQPQKDTNPLAHHLINTFGSLSKVFEANVKDLEKVNGVGSVVATFLATFVDMTHYYQESRMNYAEKIDTPYKLEIFGEPIFKHKKVEEVYVLLLKTDYSIIKCEKISKGTENKANVNIREIINLVVRENTSFVVLMHNHPVGSCQPSSEDDKLTRSLLITLAMNEVALVDHMIFSQDDTYSYLRDNKLEEYRAISNKLINNGTISVNLPISEYKDK